MEGSTRARRQDWTALSWEVGFHNPSEGDLGLSGRAGLRYMLDKQSGRYRSTGTCGEDRRDSWRNRPARICLN